jgi:hypothetical protein
MTSRVTQSRKIGTMETIEWIYYCRHTILNSLSKGRDVIYNRLLMLCDRTELNQYIGPKRNLET